MEVIDMEQLIFVIFFAAICILWFIIGVMLYHHIQYKRGAKRLKETIFTIFGKIRVGDVFVMKDSFGERDVIVTDKLIEEGIPFISYRFGSHDKEYLISAKRFILSVKQFEYEDLGE